MEMPVPSSVFNGRFRVESTLGEGGFAVVYSAIDVQTGQPVALKVLKAPAGKSYDHDTRARFQREMRVLAQLDHPHIVKELGWGESADGLLYVAFERLEGVDLSELLNDVGRFDPRDVIGVLRQLLLALDAAHRLNLLHRDIKPQNVRVLDTTPGALRVKLLDFGIARSDDASHPGITRTGELVGTPRYMSPEQLRDQPLGPTSDIYSLGLMAFELLMGKAALTGNSLLAQIDRLRSGYVFSVPELERANPALLAVVQRMTEKDPARRFARATDVIAALDAIPMYGSGPLPSGTEDTLAPGLDSSRISARLAAPPAAPPKRLAPVLAIVGLLVVAAVALGLYAEDRDEPGTARPEQRAIVSIKKPETSAPAPLPAAPTPKPAPDPGQPEPKPAYTPIPSRGCERATPYEKVQLTGVNF